MTRSAEFALRIKGRLALGCAMVGRRQRANAGRQTAVNVAACELQTKTLCASTRRLQVR
jgi:hypothetical protein